MKRYRIRPGSIAEVGLTIIGIPVTAFICAIKSMTMKRYRIRPGSIAEVGLTTIGILVVAFMWAIVFGVIG